MSWTHVEVKDTKGRLVRRSSSGDSAKAHKSADERMKRGYQKTVTKTDF
jgi:hypothetical protein